MSMRSAILAFVTLSLASGPSIAQISVAQGPVEARVERVLDGDTYEVVAYPWPEQAVWVQIRLDGVDTPEKAGKCADEKNRAESAANFVSAIFAKNLNRVNLYVIGCKGSKGGGFGRCRAQMKVGGEWLSAKLISAGYARENHGEKRLPWCPGP